MSSSSVNVDTDREREEKLLSAKKKLKAYRARQAKQGSISRRSSQISTTSSSSISSPIITSTPIRPHHVHKRSASRTSVFGPPSATSHLRKDSLGNLARSGGRPSSIHVRKDSVGGGAGAGKEVPFSPSPSPSMVSAVPPSPSAAAQKSRRRHSRTQSISISHPSSSGPIIPSEPSSNVQQQQQRPSSYIFPPRNLDPVANDLMPPRSAGYRQSLPYPSSSSTSPSFSHQSIPSNSLRNKRSSLQLSPSPLSSSFSHAHPPPSPSSGSATAATATEGHKRRPSRHQRQSSVATRRASMEIMSGVTSGCFGFGGEPLKEDVVTGVAGELEGKSVEEQWWRLNAAGRVGGGGSGGMRESYDSNADGSIGGDESRIESRMKQRESALDALEGRLRSSSETIELPLSMDSIATSSVVATSAAAAAAAGAGALVGANGGSAAGSNSTVSKRSSWGASNPTVTQAGGRGALDLGMLVEEEEEEEEEGKEGGSSSRANLKSTVDRPKTRPTSLMLPNTSPPLISQRFVPTNSPSPSDEAPSSSMKGSIGFATRSLNLTNLPMTRSVSNSLSSTSSSVESGTGSSGSVDTVMEGESEAASANTTSTATTATNGVKSQRRSVTLRSLTLAAATSASASISSEGISPIAPLTGLTGRPRRNSLLYQSIDSTPIAASNQQAAAAAAAVSAVPQRSLSISTRPSSVLLAASGERSSPLTPGAGGRNSRSGSITSKRSSISYKSSSASTSPSLAGNGVVGPSSPPQSQSNDSPVTMMTQKQMNRSSRISGLGLGKEGESGSLGSVSASASGSGSGSRSSSQGDFVTSPPISAKSSSVHSPLTSYPFPNFPASRSDSYSGLPFGDLVVSEEMGSHSLLVTSVPENDALAKQLGISGMSSPEDPLILSMQVEALRIQAEQSKAECEAVRSELSSAQGKVSELEMKNGEVERKVREMGERVEDLTMERDMLKDDIDGWRTRVADLEKVLVMEKVKVEEEKKENVLACEKIRKLGDRLTVAAQEEVAVAEMRDQIFSLVTRLEKEEKEHEETRSKLEAVLKEREGEKEKEKERERERDEKGLSVDVPRSVVDDDGNSSSEDRARRESRVSDGSAASSFSNGNMTEDVLITDGESSFSTMLSSPSSGNSSFGGNSPFAYAQFASRDKEGELTVPFSLGSLQTLAEVEEEDEDEDEDEEDRTSDDLRGSRPGSGSTGSSSDGPPKTPSKETPPPMPALHSRSDSFIRAWTFPKGPVPNSVRVAGDDEHHSFFRLGSDETLPPLPVKDLELPPFIEGTLAVEEDFVAPNVGGVPPTPASYSSTTFPNPSATHTPSNSGPPAARSASSHAQYSSRDSISSNGSGKALVSSNGSKAVTSRLSLQGISSLIGSYVASGINVPSGAAAAAAATAATRLCSGSAGGLSVDLDVNPTSSYNFHHDPSSSVPLLHSQPAAVAAKVRPAMVSGGSARSSQEKKCIEKSQQPKPRASSRSVLDFRGMCSREELIMI